MDFGTNALGEALFGAPLEDLTPPLSPVTLLAVDGVLCVLLDFDANWARRPPQAEFSARSASDEGLSSREGRRRMASETVCKLTWSISDDTGDFRRAINAYANQPILVPFWPGECLLSAIGASKWGGGLRIFYEPDWSEWQIRAGEVAPSSFTPTADCLTAPVLWGRFDSLPEALRAESGTLMESSITVVETGVAAYAIQPTGVSLTNGPAVGANTWRLQPISPNWAAPMSSGGIKMRIERERIGYGRAEVEDYATQTARRAHRATITAEGDEIAEVLALFREVVDVGSFWVPGGFIETTLASPSSGGSADIVVADSTTLAGEYGVLIMGADGAIAARKIQSILGNTITLASSPGVFAAGATVHPLLLVRSAGPRITVTWLSGAVADIALDLIELPTESTVPSGETVGTTIGALSAKWWGYVITDGVSTWKLTSYDASVNAGGLGTFTPAPIDHSDDNRELNLVRHDTEMRIGLFDDSPFERLRLDVHAPALSVQIYEGTIASPATAAVIFTGNVREPKWRGAVCTCSLAGPTALGDVRGPIAVTSPRCWVPLYSTRCGLSRGSIQIASDLKAIDVNGRLMFIEDGILVFRQMPKDYFRFGYAERLLGDGTKQRYRITGNELLTYDASIIPELGTIESETAEWQASLGEVGGIYTSKSLRIANYLVSVLKAKSYYAKIKYLVPFLGSNLASAITPLIDADARGRPTNSGFANSDFAESTGLQGSGMKMLIMPFNAAELGTGNNGGIGVWVRAMSANQSVYVTTSHINITPYSYAFALFLDNIPANRELFQWGSSESFCTANATPGAHYYHGERRAINDRELYRDGASVATSTANDVAATGQADPDLADFRLFGYNGHPESPTAAFAGRISCALWTDGTMAHADVADLYAVLRDYLIAFQEYVETGPELIASVMGAVTPLPSAFPEANWTLVPGCDKSYARCTALGNSNNFRGFPYMPKTNPSLVPVKQETPQAGKK